MSEVRGRLEVPVQYKGVEGRTVGPHDGPQLIVHTNLCEEVGIGKWLEHGPRNSPVRSTSRELPSLKPSRAGNG